MGGTRPEQNTETQAEPTLGVQDAPEGPEVFQRALALFDAGRLAEALALVEPLRKTDDAPLEAIFLAAQLAFALNRQEEALDWMGSAAAANPTLVAPPLLLGSILARLGRQGEAVEQFRVALALDPQETDGWRGLTMALLELGRYREAESAAASLLARAPEDPKAHLLMSTIHLETGRPVSAVAVAQAALRIAPQDVAALIHSARGLNQLNRSDEVIAIMACQSAPDEDPLSASKRDPLDRRARAVAIAPSELVGVAETPRARVGT